MGYARIVSREAFSEMIVSPPPTLSLATREAAGLASALIYRKGGPQARNTWHFSRSCALDNFTYRVLIGKDKAVIMLEC